MLTPHSDTPPDPQGMQAARRAAVCFAIVLLAAVGCGSDDDTTPPPSAPIIFSGEGNRLNAYESTDGFPKQNVIKNHSADPVSGLDINGQICFVPDGSRRFIAGEDTGQPSPPQGWGFFQLQGHQIGSFTAHKIGKLTPTYQGSLDNAENYGCGFLSDGRLVTSDVGNQASGSGDGQLILWYPPFDSTQVRYCKLAIDIATAGGILIDEQDRIYVASARSTPGIYRYSPPFPSTNDAAGGCGQADNTGAPLADSVTREKFIDIDGSNLVTPSAIVRNKAGHFFVSSVLNGVIAEYSAEGDFIRRVLAPPRGETLPFSTGSPFGIGIDENDNLYYADIGLVVDAGGIGPGDCNGTVRRLRFENGAPLAPETMDTDLCFPDGIGVLPPG